MIYRLAADAVVVVHFGFILFVILGALLAFRWRWIPWVHVPAALWGTGIEFFGWICPLTPLENALRRAGGAAGYTGGFIDRYIVPVIYPSGLTRDVQLVLGSLVLVLNIALYVIWFRRGRKRGDWSVP